MSTAVVVELGRSTGSAAVAAGLALARARVLDAGWVLLAELDRRGGDLMEKLFLGPDPRTDTDRDTPAGARELADQLAGIDLDRSLAPHYGTPNRPALTSYLVEVAGVPNVRILLGDPLVDGAARAAARISPELADLAGATLARTVIVDAGHWASTNAEVPRIGPADVVYAVAQADTASQNSRCLAELTALWRRLQHTNPNARLVAVLVDPAWPAADLRHLFDRQHGTVDGQRRYRVAVLDGRRERRLLGLLHSGQWRSIPDKALDRFFELASPLADPFSTPPALPAGPPSPKAASAVGPTEGRPHDGPGGRHLRIARAVTGPSAGGQPETSSFPGRSPAVAGLAGSQSDPAAGSVPVAGPTGTLPGLAAHWLSAGDLDEEGPDPAWWPFLDGDAIGPAPAADADLSPAMRAALGLGPLVPSDDPDRSGSTWREIRGEVGQ